MPTIDQLAPALAASDLDAFPASQSGIARRVTRAQILAGTQQQLTVPSGLLLGRSSPGYGPPEPITLGTGLALTNGVLDIHTVQTADSVEPVTPEQFGAAGDGVTDDAAAILAAVATLRPVHFGPRVYAMRAQCTIAVPAIFVGVPGQTTLRQISGIGGAWISIQGISFRASDIIFDANRVASTTPVWSVLVTASCLETRFLGCAFLNARSAVLGNGITFLSSDPASSSHTLDDCQAAGNEAHGIWLQAVDGARVTNSCAHDNGSYGICADYNDPSFIQALRLSSIIGNRCWSNDRGISVGNFNATNSQPPVWGNANPDAVGILVQANICDDNRFYGLAVSGMSIAVLGNLLTNNGTSSDGGAGLLANCSSSTLAYNIITGSSHYGIDAGGSLDLAIDGNRIAGAAIGVNPGGSRGVSVTGNSITATQWAVTVYNVETDGKGANFGLSTTNLTIDGNTISLIDGASGVLLLDAPQGVAVCDNSFYGSGTAVVAQALHAHTDSILVSGNRWNNTPRLFANPVAINGLQTVQLPDIADEAMLSFAPLGIQSIMLQHQLAIIGQIGFVKMIAGGTNYTNATVTISGSGSGATAFAYIAGGMIIGVSLVTPGSGYGSPGSVATVVINGDGSGARATVSVGLPVPEGRRIRLACNTAVRFTRLGSTPFQENWTLADMTVPANATIAFTGTFGAWRADAVPLADYLAPPGDGSLILRSQPGADIVLRPASGHLHIASDAEPVGYLALTGHGSPNGVVSAPPGSDYRNLDGGAGQTLWLKQTGANAQGWFAVA